MMVGPRRPRRAWRVIHVLIALGASAVALGVLAFGYGTVPALGPALDPGHGVWTSAGGAVLPHSQALAIPGLAHPVRVSFTSDGVASIHASVDSDLRQVRVAARPAAHRPAGMGRHTAIRPGRPRAGGVLARGERLPRPGPGQPRLAGAVFPGRRLPGELDPGGQPGRSGGPDPGTGLHHHPAGLRAA